MPDTELILYRIQVLEQRLESLEKSVMNLVSLADRGKGAFWAGMTLAGAIGTTIGFLVEFWRRHL